MVAIFPPPGYSGQNSKSHCLAVLSDQPEAQPTLSKYTARRSETSLLSSSLGLMPVMLRVKLSLPRRRGASLMVQMTLSHVRMVRRGLVVFALVVSRGLAVVPGRMFVVFRCFAMMLCRFLRHTHSYGSWFLLRSANATGLTLRACDTQMNNSYPAGVVSGLSQLHTFLYPTGAAKRLQFEI